MNRVSECKEKQEPEVKEAAVGSIWKWSENEKYYMILIDGKHVELDTGKLHSWELSNEALAAYYTQIFCVTIERDPDEH